MSSRSLNKVILIGNLTRDPELRYTPAGTAVCTMGVATNRSWTTQSGETKEESEFHRVVAWNKLAELCAQLLSKGRKVYVEGRLATHSWTAQDGAQRSSTEVVIEDMIILDSKKVAVAPIKDGQSETQVPERQIHDDGPMSHSSQAPVVSSSKPKTTVIHQSQEQNLVSPDMKTEESPAEVSQASEDISPDDIPF